MSVVTVGVVGAMLYFSIFGVGFLVRPQLVAQFGLRWVGDSASPEGVGRTEVRCYYGALSCALAAFVGYLWANDAGLHAITGVLMLASAVFVTRVVGTALESAWRAPYTRVALPAEGAFVLALAVVRVLAS